MEHLKCSDFSHKYSKSTPFPAEMECLRAAMFPQNCRFFIAVLGGNYRFAIYSLIILSKLFFIHPQPQRGVGDIIDFFAVHGVIAVVQLFRIIFFRQLVIACAPEAEPVSALQDGPRELQHRIVRVARAMQTQRRRAEAVEADVLQRSVRLCARQCSCWKCMV